MSMPNIHPIIVHLPIGLLSIYALLELIRWKKITLHRSWFDIKASFVILGTIAGFFTLSTGEAIEHMFRGTELDKVVEVHSLFANITVWIFAVLAIAYAAVFMEQNNIHYRFPARIQKIFRSLCILSSVILRGYVSISLAIIGLITLTITGALGGALVYGPEIDPVVNAIYHIFF